MTPDELWEKHSISYMGGPVFMTKADFLAAIAEYGAAVRQRDANICSVKGYYIPAAAISREPLP